MSFAHVIEKTKASPLATKPTGAPLPSPAPRGSPAEPPSPEARVGSVLAAEKAPVEKRVPRADEPLELDGAARAATLLAPPTPIGPPPPSLAPSTTPALDPHLAAELVERAAFWGDGERGLARLRFGNRARAGLAGTTVTLEHDGEALRLRIDDDPDLAARLRERLASRGITVEE